MLVSNYIVRVVKKKYFSTRTKLEELRYVIASVRLNGPNELSISVVRFPSIVCVLFVTRALLAYVYLPVVQKELDVFREVVWNSSRGRKQKDKLLPTGIPNHIYRNPEEYGAEDCGTHLSESFLEELEEATGVTDDDHDFLTPTERLICETLLPDPSSLKPYDAADAYIRLKNDPAWLEILELTETSGGQSSSST